MNRRFIFGVAAVVISGALLGSVLGAQAPTTSTTTTQSTTTTTTTTTAAGGSVKAGVFTADQAKRGQSVYNDACAKCHLEDLSGGATSPPLKGADFLNGWKAKTVGALFDELRMTMPFDSPGSLTAAQYADVLAYMLSANTFPAGEKELDKDPAALAQIKMDTP